MSRVDDLYARFEERFRGPRGAILERLGDYVPFLELLESRHASRRAVDCGCGRGEWLELLMHRGWDALGIDSNSRMLDEASKHGVKTLLGDAVAHLSSLPDASVQLVTAFHLVEHLPTELLLTFLAEMNRVLAADGMIVLETPNPENVMVGTSNFYLDPTHEKPIPPLLLQFYLEQSGLPSAHIMRINGERRIDPVDSIEAAIRPLFFSALDYAVIGLKTSDRQYVDAVRVQVDRSTQSPPSELEAIRAFDQVQRARAIANDGGDGATVDVLRHVVLESRDAIHEAILAVYNTITPLAEHLSGTDASIAALHALVHAESDATRALVADTQVRQAELSESIERTDHGLRDAIGQIDVRHLLAEAEARSATSIDSLRAEVQEAVWKLSVRTEALADLQAIAAREHASVAAQSNASLHRALKPLHAAAEDLQAETARRRVAAEQARDTLDRLRTEIAALHDELGQSMTRTSVAMTRQAESVQGTLRQALTTARRNSDAREFRIVAALDALRRANHEALVDRQSSQAEDRQAETDRRLQQAVRDAAERTAALYVDSVSWRITSPLRATTKWMTRLRSGMASSDGTTPVGRGVLSIPWVWKLGRTAVRLVPGLRNRVLRSLSQKDLLINPLSDGRSVEAALGPRFRDEEDDQMDEAERIALMSSTVRRYYGRLSAVQAVHAAKTD